MILIVEYSLIPLILECKKCHLDYGYVCVSTVENDNPASKFLGDADVKSLY